MSYYYLLFFKAKKLNRAYIYLFVEDIALMSIALKVGIINEVGDYGRKNGCTPPSLMEVVDRIIDTGIIIEKFLVSLLGPFL